jgi:hypothetical protein
MEEAGEDPTNRPARESEPILGRAGGLPWTSDEAEPPGDDDLPRNTAGATVMRVPGSLSFVCLLMLLNLLMGRTSLAHPVSMTQTDVFATRQSLKVSIDLFVEDLFLFHSLEPTDDNFLRKEDILSASEKHKAFLLERFTVRDANGELIAGRVTGVKLGEIDAKGIPMTDLMAHSLVYQIEFPLPPETSFVTFAQTLGTTQFGFPAIMMLRIKQEGSEVPYVAEMRSNEPHTVKLDWDHPPLSPEASEKDWEAWEATRREKSLGITSYSSVYSFLYIEDYEIRHEVLVPLLTLEASLPIERADPDFLDVAEQEKAGPAIKAFFEKANPIKIDDVLATPTVDRLDFYGLDFKDFAQKADRRRVSMINARVGVILRYPLKSRPRTVEVAWDLFNKYVWGAQMVIYSEEKNFSQFFSPYQKTFRWTSPERPAAVPIESVEYKAPPDAPKRMNRWFEILVIVVGLTASSLMQPYFSLAKRCLILFASSCALAAAMLAIDRAGLMQIWPKTPPPSNEEARALFDRVLHNVYRSFEYRDDAQVYDALAKSLAGPILEKTYLDIKKGLVVLEQGGAQARVTRIALSDAQAQPIAGGKDPRGFDLLATWEVEGTVEHWGHIHQRINEYQALFSVEPVDRVWRITAMNVQSDKRKSFKTRLRSFQ